MGTNTVIVLPSELSLEEFRLRESTEIEAARRRPQTADALDAQADLKPLSLTTTRSTTSWTSPRLAGWRPLRTVEAELDAARRRRALNAAASG